MVTRNRPTTSSLEGPEPYRRAPRVPFGESALLEGLGDVAWWKRPSQLTVNALDALDPREYNGRPEYTRSGEPPNQATSTRGQRDQRKQQRADLRGEPPNQTRTTQFKGQEQSLKGQRADSARLQAQADAYGSEGAEGDPYSEFLQDYLAKLSGSYDSQIDAIGGLGSAFQDQAAEAQGNIGEFFDYAGDVARGGKTPTQETYDTATGNVGSIYDNLGETLQGMPQQLTDIASGAAGSAVGSSVAGRVASATAPFMAAGETSRANANANLTQNNAAGQNYLTQLASSTGAEAGMHQSAVESAMQQQLQLVAYRQAELEGSKQRALMEVSSDVAGDSSERMAQAALASSLGLDLPEGVDPMDYLRGRDMMSGGSVDPIKQERDLLGLEQARLNLSQDINPDLERDRTIGSLTPPASHGFDNILRNVEADFAPGRDDPKDMAMKLLQELDAYALGGGLDTNFTNSSLISANEVEEEIRDAIRRIYG